MTKISFVLLLSVLLYQSMSITLREPRQQVSHLAAGGLFYDQTNCVIKTLISQSNNILDSNTAGNVYLRSGNGGLNQKWYLSGLFSYGAVNRYFMFNMGTMRNLDSDAAGSVYTLSPNEGPWQIWEFTGLNGQACPVNAGTCQATIKNYQTGRALDLAHSGTVTTFPYHGLANQQWEITCQ